jgi:hypothetical protein
MGTHGRSDYYCEANRTGCVAQPANTWSSLVYVVAAATIAASARRHAATASRAERFVAGAVVVECLLLAPASAAYHASLTRLTERLDMSGTYGVVAALLALVVARLLGPSATTSVAAGLLVAVGGTHALAAIFKYSIQDDTVFPLLLVLLVVGFAALARARLADARLVAIGALAAAVAGALRVLDVRKVLCAPESLLQGHAAWHALTAVAIVLGFEGLYRERAA